MIYVSSACLKHEKIKDSVEELARNGFRHIELSGGTKYYEGYLEDLLSLRDRYELDYLIHNYFPPPKRDFILNLASLNDEIYQRTLEHFENALLLSKKLGSRKFGLHAGFFMDFDIREIGQNISLSELCDRDKAIRRFCEGYEYLQRITAGIALYIENNVLSYENALAFRGQNPFMLTDYNGYEELKSRINFKLLLDVAHLRVSAHSLNLGFEEQFHKMFPISDYVHVSDNDGVHDQNLCFRDDNYVLDILRAYDFSKKTVTLETYGDIPGIKRSEAALKESLCLR